MILRIYPDNSDYHRYVFTKHTNRKRALDFAIKKAREYWPYSECYSAEIIESKTDYLWNNSKFNQERGI